MKRAAATRWRVMSGEPTPTCGSGCGASGISAASTYTDRATAERVVARTLARQRSRVDQWLARQGSRPNLALDYRGDGRETIGRSLTRRSPQPVACTRCRGRAPMDGGRGFIVLTSYPEISR